ncbi:hypothetical protein OIU78_022957 [Salix suchowensis]|nr:hypothetical protein OIU78_022957 [Salix suchowensis]
MATEDFTFPVLTDPVSCIIDSPPLWCLSPAACPGPFHEEPSEESSTDGEESDQEEVCKNRSPVPDPSLSGTGGAGCGGNQGVQDWILRQFTQGCVRALKLSKPKGTSIISPRKPGMVVFMKVLKRLFLIHNSHRSAKHRSSYRPSVKGHRSQTAVKIGSW